MPAIQQKNAGFLTTIISKLLDESTKQSPDARQPGTGVTFQDMQNQHAQQRKVMDQQIASEEGDIRRYSRYGIQGLIGPAPAPVPKQQKKVPRILAAVTQWPEHIAEGLARGYLPPNYNPSDPSTYPTSGLVGLMHKYAPPTENNTLLYAKTLADKLGVDMNNVSKEQMLHPGMLKKWVNEQAIYEGYYAKGDKPNLPQRLNNPGNLYFIGQKGAVRDPQSGLAKFKNAQLGFEALQRQLVRDAEKFLP